MIVYNASNVDRQWLKNVSPKMIRYTARPTSTGMKTFLFALTFSCLFCSTGERFSRIRKQLVLKTLPFPARLLHVKYNCEKRLRHENFDHRLFSRSNTHFRLQYWPYVY